MLSDRDRRNEYLMTRLRTSDGLSLKAFEAAFGPQAAARLVLEARPLLEAETLRREGDRLLIPPERFLTSDAVIGTLLSRNRTPHATDLTRRTLHKHRKSWFIYK